MMTENFPFSFVESTLPPNDEELTAHVPSGLETREELFNVLAEQLNFPGYFGRNWDALYDLLRDFSWVSEKTIRIIHADCPNLEEVGQQRMYLKVLKDSVLDWKPGEDHSLQASFPKSVEKLVVEILEGSM